jgi:hypothetical protein
MDADQIEKLVQEGRRIIQGQTGVQHLKFSDHTKAYSQAPKAKVL